jgi:adenosylcobyric acid synthase
VLGVLPYFQPQLPAEDSLDLFDRRTAKPDAEIHIGVVRLPRMANFTDFDPLMAEPTVQVTYFDRPDVWQKFDAIILPGSKTTIADCQWLFSSGIAEMILHHVAAGGVLMGICGGLQMMGDAIDDPAGLEGQVGKFAGLGCFAARTTITEQKILRQRQVDSAYFDTRIPVCGYEIHQGVTTWTKIANIQPLFQDESLGWVVQDRMWGTYLHGIFDNGQWRRLWLNQLRQRTGLAPLSTAIADHSVQRDEALDAVADLVSEHLNIKLLM